MSKKKILTDQELKDRRQRRAAYMKAWKEKNKEHVKQYNDTYFEENREYNKERCKAYKKNNPDKILAQNRLWNINNRQERNRLNNEPALSICNDTLQLLLSSPYDWKFNKAAIPPFTTIPYQQDYILALKRLAQGRL